MIKASIDIGSNSVLLLVVEVSETGQIYKTLANESHVTGLGKGLDIDGQFSDESMRLTFDVLMQYLKICKNLAIPASSIMATATEAARKANNSIEYFDKIKKSLDINIKIITGEAEAYLSTAGILLGAPFDSTIIAVMDIGGASTELIEVEVNAKKIIKSFSMPVGAVRLTSWIEKNVSEKEMRKIYDAFEDDLNVIRHKKIYCVAGTMTSVANILLGHKNFVESEVHGFKVELPVLESLYTKLNPMTAKELELKYPFLGKRSLTIKAGLLLAINILSRIGAEKIEISTYGLRYGSVIMEKIPEDFLFNKEK